MTYRADIEIAVRGAQELKRLQNEIRLSADAVNSLNSSFAGVANLIPRSINNLNKIVAEAAANFNAVALGTEEAVTAARAYVNATDALNSGLRERLRLVRSIEAAETAAQRTIRPGDAGYGQQIPTLPPALVKAKEIQQNWAAFFRDAAEVATDLRSVGAAKALNLKQNWNTFFTEAAELGNDLKATAAAKALNLKQNWNTFFTEAAELAADLAASAQRTAAAIRQREGAASNLARQRLANEAARREERAAFLAGSSTNFPFGPNPSSKRFRFEGDVSPERAEAALVAKEREQQRRANQQLFAEERQQLITLDRLRAEAAQKQTQRIQALAKTVRGSLSSAAIGGAFPLLFGQSPQAAVGGAIGGLLGGQAGGFAGSLIGTALGEIEAAKARIKELTAELGFSAAQGRVLADAFELAGRNSQQLEAAVTNIQGLGLSTAETSSALKIAVELSREYGGSVEKIAQAFADTLESGKVSVSTLNKFTAQGIPIQDTLAAKLGVSRTKLLEMAKDGAISVQQVSDVLVQMGQEAEKTANKGETGFDRFTKAVANIASAISSAAGAILQNLVPALDTVLTRLASIITQATRAINLISDATVGELSSAVFGAGFARGTGFINKGNVDAITQALGNLRPEIATTREELKKIEVAAASAQAELSKYGGDLGEYSQKTAQMQLSRVQRGIIRRRQELGAPGGPVSIQSITAPVNLPPSGGGGKGGRGADAAAREAERVAKALRDTQAETELLRIQAGIQDRIFQAEQAKDPLLAARLKGEEEILNIQAKYASALANESNIRVQEALVVKGLQEIENARLKTAQTLEQIESERAEKYNTLIEDLNLELELKNTVTEFDRERLRIEFEIARLRKENIYSEGQLLVIQAKRLALAKKDTPGQARMKELQKSLADLTNLENIGVMAADNIGMAFGQAFQDIANGSATAQEALASMMKSIGENFVNMAAQIIAQQIIMITLGAILKALGISMPGSSGGGGGGVSALGASPGDWANTTALQGLVPAAEGAYWTGGFKAFADGGMVTGPTLGLVGEGGEPEYIIPASKMSAAMARYNAGARGAAVIPGEGGAEAGGTATMTAPAGAIDVRYTVERINSVDYVTADQFQRGISQAAKQGAREGEQATLRRLQQSRSTRSRLGMV